VHSLDSALLAGHHLFMKRIAPAMPKKVRTDSRYKMPNLAVRRIALQSLYWLNTLPDAVLPASREAMEYTIRKDWLSVERVQEAFTCGAAPGCRYNFFWQSPWNDA